ncbi:MAG: dihydroxy-acid dehydratase [Clostridia bacterium]|nr:dihydroxy-acid dehydratase [Clostridia bacterium]
MEHNYSEKWKKRGDRTGLIRNALLKSMGYTDADIEKPIIGIINTWAETNPGHAHFRQLAEAVKRGVWAAGGFPLEVNTLSICEVFFDISSLVYRNLLSITTEELMARHPFDGVVLIGGCDKNIPAQLMAAVSVNKPTIYVPGGAMLPGNYKGRTLVCGTDSFYLYNDYTSGKITLDEMTRYEGCLYGSPGACPIMGTANTCQTVTEALGIALPNAAACLGLSGEKMRICEESGRRVVGLVKEDVKCLDIINRRSIENAIRVLMAAGGSTNLIIHLIAIARRAGIDLKLEDFERISNETPVLVNVKPHGTGAVGTDFHDAGGVQALMKELEGSLDLDCLTVTGKTVGENLKEADYAYNRDIIRPLDDPLNEKGGISVLFGNLAPKGAVIKRSAASPHLLHHRDPAKVFEDLEACQAYLLDENSDVTKDTVIVLRGYGPVGAPGMPENGNYMPLPPKLNREGIKDFVRITDSRMSGGCFGTQVLHVAPESAVGGPLAAVRDGDIIHLDVDRNLIELEVDEAEIARRLAEYKPGTTHDDIDRGFVRNFIDNVTQADEGCDLRYMQYVDHEKKEKER